MTDRYIAYLVTLSRDVRDDSPYADAFVKALKLMRYVASVTPVVGEYGSHEEAVHERSKAELRRLVYELADQIDDLPMDK